MAWLLIVDRRRVALPSQPPSYLLLSRLRFGRQSCQIVEEPKGVLINVASKLQFTYKDACVEHDPHVNHDAEATQAATSAVKGVLKNAFKLE